MKQLFTFAVLGLLSAAIVGCEASAEVDADDDDTTVRTTRVDRDNNDTTVKKTTTIDDDGDKTTRTEIRRD
jgi:hypothetical protein